MNIEKQMIEYFKDLNLHVKHYFVADMLRINKESEIWPCFIGFTEGEIYLIKMDRDLKQTDCLSFDIERDQVLVKKKFLSQMIKISLKKDGVTYYLETLRKMKGFSNQGQSIDRLIELLGENNA